MKRILLQIKRFFFLEYVIFGILIAFLLNSSGSCRKDDTGLRDSPGIPVVDVGKIDEGAKAVEAAFESGEVNSIQSILTEDALNLYDADLSKVDKNNFKKLGEALKSRELKVYTDLYAEYNYTKDGITFSISMARQEDGTWKLMRF